MSKTLAELERDCRKWREVCDSLLDFGQQAVSTARLCGEIGLFDTAAALGLIAGGVAGLIKDTLLPAVEHHHAEHYAAKQEVLKLEENLGEAS